MIAEWANVDPFQLLKPTFGGSGYDIVAAKANGPMLFQKFNGKNRWDKSDFNPKRGRNRTLDAVCDTLENIHLPISNLTFLRKRRKPLKGSVRTLILSLRKQIKEVGLS